MLDWFFKKRGTSAAAPQVPAAPGKTAHATAGKAVAPAREAVDTSADWTPRLQAAQGDDAALLQLLQAAPVLAIKLAAVQALGSEAALKQAERSLRKQDSRVYRAARSRLEESVARREAQAGATILLGTAAALAEEPLVALNQLAALDRAWQALPAQHLLPAHTAAFAALRERIDAGLQAAGQAQQEARRLKAQAAEAAAAAAISEAAQTAERERAAIELQREAAQAAAKEAQAPPPTTEPVRAAPKALSAEQLHRLDTTLQGAESALAQGQLGDLQRCLQALDAAAEAAGTALWPDALLARLHTLHAERKRLRGWQQWCGARVRDDLTAEAEALAVLTTNLTTKLNVKAHADAIQALRRRWKELDRTGAAASPAQWQRFDTALRTAHGPVAEQHAALQAARQNNLLAREALLVQLEADAGAPLHEAPDARDAPDLRTQAQALARFQAAWRQLGPLEHTVPAAARAGLQERLRAAVARIEEPLQSARLGAEAGRAQLIADAQALSATTAAGDGFPSDDTLWRVRELQHRWQQQARTLPLARGVETALWARFKAATDAVFAQRAAALAARDAAVAGQVAAHEALLARLAALPADMPGAELRRALGEVERAWQPGPDWPRGTANALQARFQTARAAVLAQAAGSAQRQWQQQCDSLLAELALCDESEAAAPTCADTLPIQAPAQLPAAWAQALAQRRAQAAPGPLSEAAVDDLLLQLEAALGVAPTPELADARRKLKLQALKHTLEGRTPAAQGAAQPAAWLATLLAQRGGGTPQSAAQRTRLSALVAALKQAPPGALAGPSTPQAERHTTHHTGA